jgi:hypothetical protein
MAKTKLKIGLLISSYHIANWQFKIVEELKNSNFAEISLVIKSNEHLINMPSRFFGGLNKASKILLNTHLKLDKFILGRTANYSKKLDSKVLLKDVCEVTLTPVGDRLTNKFDDKEVIKIKAFNLDIILNFGFGQLTGDLLTVAKYGIWLYGSTNKNVSKDEQFGYWEVIKELGTTDSMLQILNGDTKSGKVIHFSSILTNPTSISKNRNLCYWRATTIVPRIVEGLFNLGEPYLFRLEDKYKKEINFYNGEFKAFLTPLTAFKNLIIHFWKVIKRLIQKLFFVDHWDILYRMNSKEIFMSSIDEFKLLLSPVDRSWTDPFVVTKDDKYFLFVEELIYKTNKGHITVVEMDNKGNLIGSKKVLERTYHLSYPFLLKIDGTYYMIPETGENKTVEIYKCSEFPYKWEFVMNLMEGVRTGDVTVFHYNNKWWLFCCVDKTGIHEGLLDELHLFYSDNLFTKDWQSHPCNPINTDTKTARSAGEIFIKDDKIYRPSQDCSGIYGRGINLNEIIKLSETEYEEVLTQKVIPNNDLGIIGVHTFNADGKITVIDGFKYRRRINNKVTPVYKNYLHGYKYVPLLIFDANTSQVLIS